MIYNIVIVTIVVVVWDYNDLSEDVFHGIRIIFFVFSPLGQNVQTGLFNLSPCYKVVIRPKQQVIICVDVTYMSDDS